MVSGLTKRQAEIYDFIRSYTEREGYPPSIRDIGRNFGIRSTNGVSDHLKALERKGKISRREFKSRALAVNPREGLEAIEDLSGRVVEIPVLGMVPAGTPMLAEENIEDRVYLDSFFVAPGQEVFALRVKGESMIGDGIHDGDYIFVRKQLEAPRGAIVVVMVDGEATVKRFYKEVDHIRLQPSNPVMDPILVPEELFVDTMILGAVVGVYRRM
jgi:repressor LexA